MISSFSTVYSCMQFKSLIYYADLFPFTVTKAEVVFSDTFYEGKPLLRQRHSEHYKLNTTKNFGLRMEWERNKILFDTQSIDRNYNKTFIRYNIIFSAQRKWVFEVTSSYHSLAQGSPKRAYFCCNFILVNMLFVIGADFIRRRSANQLN